MRFTPTTTQASACLQPWTTRCAMHSAQRHAHALYCLCVCGHLTKVQHTTGARGRVSVARTAAELLTRVSLSHSLPRTRWQGDGPRILHTGFLIKQGRVRKNWMNRWFVLWDDAKLRSASTHSHTKTDTLSLFSASSDANTSLLNATQRSANTTKGAQRGVCRNAPLFCNTDCGVLFAVGVARCPY